jgi:asparagine synthase (glutamine-hydrolysing)
MCGICGKINFQKDQPVEGRLIEAMCAQLRHRGPDDQGIYLDNNVGMGMRRLSIIDLSTGKQPISNEDGFVWVVFNGEIYNFLELKRELKSRGHYFYTNTDTEVLIHLYEDYGPDFVSQLNGMFAIALWDKRRKSLILARDRIGIKPLYYMIGKDKLLFGSELKAILQDDVEKKIDLQALSDFLSLNYIPAPRTIFKGIKKLLPGQLLIYTNGRIRLHKYWDVEYRPEDNGLENYSEEHYSEALLDLLKKSVKKRLISDVPLGVFLSGGIDSSTIVALMHEVSSAKIKTFSIGFEEKSFNELDRARLIADKFNTDHHELIVQIKAVELLPKITHYFDEPFADSSAIPVYLVSQLAREHVKVVLVGDGGDELFAGYETYAAFKFANQYKKMPLFLANKIIPFLVEKLPVSHNKISFDYKAKRFVKSALLPPENGHYWWKVIFTEEAKKEMFIPAANGSLADTYRMFHHYYRQYPSIDTLARLQYTDTKVYLPDDILVKTDRMTMAHSLEGRVPLLDHEVVEFVANIPSRLKLKGLDKKYILKKTMDPKLPKTTLHGKKQGFNVPVPSWLCHELHDMVRDVLSPKRIGELGIFKAEYVNQLIKDHQAKRADYSRNLWGLLAFMLWYEEYMR